MKKAAATQAPNLGTKRTCPKCALKFYDFAKAEIHCPKCHTEVDPNAELSFRAPVEKKAKPKSIVRDDEEEVVVASSDAFESVEDLGDDDESLDGIASADDGDDEDA
jgi:uncharacterized protein (TIGR02300 family)